MDLGLVVKVCDETIGVVVLGLVEWRKEWEVVPVTIILIPHVISHTERVITPQLLKPFNKQWQMATNY